MVDEVFTRDNVPTIAPEDETSQKCGSVVPLPVHNFVQPFDMYQGGVGALLLNVDPMAIEGA